MLLKFSLFEAVKNQSDIKLEPNSLIKNLHINTLTHSILNSQFNKNNALVQHMTVFCQIVSMSRLFETLERRVFQYPTLRNLSVSCMGLLRFSLSYICIVLMFFVRMMNGVLLSHTLVMDAGYTVVCQAFLRYWSMLIEEGVAALSPRRHALLLLRRIGLSPHPCLHHFYFAKILIISRCKYTRGWISITPYKRSAVRWQNILPISVSKRRDMDTIWQKTVICCTRANIYSYILYWGLIGQKRTVAL